MSQYHPLQQVIRGDEALRALITTLRKFDVGHLALYDGTFPYVIPVNHTYLDGRLLIHCGLVGKKVDVIRGNPAASYGVYAPVDGVVAFDSPESTARSCQKNYESVVCHGYARLVEDLAERRRLMGVFARDYRHAELRHAEEETCNCIVLDILEMTGRYAYHPAPKTIYYYAFQERGINQPYLEEAK